MLTSTTMAASTLCAPLVDGPRTTLTMVGRTSTTLFLRSPAAPFGLSLQTPASVRLPQALVVRDLPDGELSLRLGAGALWYDDLPVSVVRWWEPSQVPRGCLPPDWSTEAGAEGLIDGWREFLGSGDGLTPYGDDLLSGALLGLRAAAHPGTALLARALATTDLEQHTTAVSAGVLRAAAAGWCIPEVSELLGALATRSDLRPARAALLAVGHSSGRGLLAGLGLVLAPLAPVLAA